MGTDIHLFVECDNSNDAPAFSNASGLRSFSYGELLATRDYKIFDALAGARRHVVTGGMDTECMIQPRGLPSPVSDAIYYRYYLIVDEPRYPDLWADHVPFRLWALPPVPLEDADEWVRKGLSHYAPVSLNALGRPARRRVSNPDWHSASWLFRDELLAIMQSSDLRLEDLSREWRHILLLLDQLSLDYGDNRVRVVFWFDN